MFPAASRATALSVCSPSVSAVVFQASEYGLAVSAEPTLAPSTRNCTLCTPTASEALAVTVGVPDTVAPALGELIETVGSVVVDRERHGRGGARVPGRVAWPPRVSVWLPSESQLVSPDSV